MKSTKSISALLLAAAVTVFFSFSSCEQTAEKTTETEQTEIEDDDMDENEDPISEFREALAMLPVKDRAETFNGMTAEFKSTLWRSRFTELIENDRSQEQKDVLLGMIEYISPELYAEEGGAEFDKYLSENMEAINTAFNNDSTALRNAFTKISDEQPDLEPSEDEGGEKGAKKKEPCECSVASDWCPIRFKCKLANCKASNWGCGTLWRFPCDGLCFAKK